MRLEALSEERYLKKEGHTQEEVEVRVLNTLQHDAGTGDRRRLLLLCQAPDVSCMKVHGPAAGACCKVRA